MDEYNIIHQCHMDSLAELTSKQDITAALGGNLKQSFSSDSYSSYPISSAKHTKTTTFGAISNEKSQTRPAKLLKTNSWNSSTTTEHESPNHSSPTSQLLSFETSNSPPTNPKQFYNCSLKPKVEASSPRNTHPPVHLIPKNPLESHNYAANDHHGTKRSYSSMTRAPSLAQDHIMAERKRREKLSQRFIALSAIVPGLKKVPFILFFSFIRKF